MNKEYIQVGEIFIVSTDKGLKKVERVDNMTKILETENNIEEIENLKNEVKENKEFILLKKVYPYLKDKVVKKFYYVLISVAISTLILTSIISNIYTAILAFVALLVPATIGEYLMFTINEHKAKKFYKDIYKSSDELLSNELENQNEKMKNLRKESKVLAKNDLGILGDTITINRTKLIDDLKRKLELIEDYQLMKKDLIEYSKDHFASIKLRNMGYSESDVNFIYTLMEQDIKQEEKQKTLKLEKK